MIATPSPSLLIASLSLLSFACASAPGPGPGAPAAMRSAEEARTLSRSPVSPEELALLQGALLFGAEDVEALRRSRPILEPQVEDILDVWYGFVGSTPQLLESFVDAKSGEPDGRYLAQVRERFGAWILETAEAEYDQDWLDRQHEIGLRHHSTAKNRTDGVDSTPIVHFRYLQALVYPITATLKPFLEKGLASPEEVERMHQAWTKSVLLQAILWSHPYVNEGEF